MKENQPSAGVKGESPVLTPPAAHSKFMPMTIHTPGNVPSLAAVAVLIMLTVATVGCTGGSPFGVRTGAELAPRISGERALELVDELAPLVRLPGTPGYDRALVEIADRLAAGGFVPLAAPPATGGSVPPGTPTGYVWVLADSIPFDIWQPIGGRLDVLGPDGWCVTDTDTAPTTLARNSRPTPPGGITTRLFNLGNGTFPAEYEGRDVHGAIVYGRRSLTDIYRAAVLERGAAGVVSASAPDWQATDTHPELVPAGTVGREGFGFTLSVSDALRLEAALEQAGGSLPVRAEVEAAYLTERLSRTLIAVIPGTEAASEAVAVIAPFSGPAPGASDVSGAAALVEAANALLAAVNEGRLDRPRRSMIFLFGATGLSVRAWTERRPDVVDSLHSVTLLHLVGARPDTAERQVLLERYPDPAALWTRPPDWHTPWGAAPPPWPCPGHYLSLFTGELARTLAEQHDGWTSAETPYEGGSEHTVLLEAGLPAQRLWYFPDPLYRSQLDTPGHLDPQQIAAAALVAATSAWISARADRAGAERLLTLVYDRAVARMSAGIETARANLEGGAGDRLLEQEILNAWKIWYLEAIESVLAQPLPGEVGKLRRDVLATVRSLENRWDEAMIGIGLAPVAQPERLQPDLPPGR